MKVSKWADIQPSGRESVHHPLLRVSKRHGILERVQGANFERAQHGADGHGVGLWDLKLTEESQ